MSALRVYAPAECDAAGVPLDWERCRACEGSGLVGVIKAGQVARVSLVSGGMVVEPTCPTCDGHGSLKVAALHGVVTSARYRNPWWEEFSPGSAPLYPADPVAAGDQIGAHASAIERAAEEMCRFLAEVPRCEDCHHPASDGTWVGLLPREEAIVGCLQDGLDPTEVLRPEDPEATHWSPCDQHCTHGGPVRHRDDGEEWTTTEGLARGGSAILAKHVQTQASWRHVDLRTLSWPHDLRPESLAVLCTRCFAVRARR